MVLAKNLTTCAENTILVLGLQLRKLERVTHLDLKSMS